MTTLAAIPLIGAWGAVLLLSKWFISELEVAFTFFLLFIPFYFMLFITALMVIWTINIFRKRYAVERLRAAIPFALLVAILWVYFFVPFSFTKVKLEHARFASAREEVVAAIQNNAYTDDGYNNIKLLPGQRHLSSDGEVHVYQNDEQGCVVGFWVFRGLMMNSSTTVIYTSYAEPPTAATLHRAEVYWVKELGENWYFVCVY